MTPKECILIRELLPLYAEDLISEETVEYVKEHLNGCERCMREWELFSATLPDPLPVSTGNITSRKSFENRLFGRLKKTITAAVLLLVIGGAGLTYASYNAGKHIGIDDPAYRFARELNLFTEINQTKTADGRQVTIEKGLFDSTRSILFIRFSGPFKDLPEVSLSDENGNQYDQRSGKGWQNKYLMLEFEPLSMETGQVNVSLTMGEQGNNRLEYTFPVNVAKTAQYTTIVYPNQEKKLPDLKITLEKAVLGVSEAAFKVRFDWPVDGSVAAIALGKGGAYFPTSVTKAPETPPPPGMGTPPPGGLMSGYAAAYGIYYRSQDPPENRPALYDLTERLEVAVQKGEYRTTQFPCQVEAVFKFAPVKQGTEYMEILLPPIYLYEKIADPPKYYLNFAEKNELDLDQSISCRDGKVIIEKVWLEKNRVYLSYKMESSSNPDVILPHFTLTDALGMKQAEPRFDSETPEVMMFALYDEEMREFHLSLDSTGYLLSREKFTLDLRDKN